MHDGRGDVPDASPFGGIVPGCTDGEDIVARHRYLNSIGIPESSIVNLEYFDYARSKYLALGMPDTMPPKGLASGLCL